MLRSPGQGRPRGGVPQRTPPPGTTTTNLKECDVQPGRSGFAGAAARSATGATAVTCGGLTVPDPYPIQTLLCCASCEQPLYGTQLPDGTRVYRGRCGCRLHGLDAGQIERRVYAEVQRVAFGPDEATPVRDHLAPLALIAFACVRVGATVDDLSFIPHI